MMLKDIIFISILLLILFWLFYKKYDNFTIYSYNASDIQDTFPSQLEIETNKIKILLDNEFKQNQDFNLDKIDKTTFQKFSFYENFIFEKKFKEICINKLKENLSKDFLNIDLISTKEFNNIYWKDISNNRHYIFDITIFSKNYGFTRIFSVYLILNNINNYLLDNGEYIPNLNLDNLDITIKYIKENQYNLENLKLLPGDPLFDYFEIKNKLYLTDPFITSNKDMQITEDLKKSFEEVLTKKNESIKLYSTGNCFDSQNNIIFTDKNSDENKINCETQDLLNKWDTIPFNDFGCPFYKKNLNYPNTFGKLIDNKCEMPQNIKQQGYRYYSNEPKYSPLCYNCKTDLLNENSTLGKCCDKQFDKLEYPQLISPDYAYPNDKLLRQKYKNSFEEKFLRID